MRTIKMRPEDVQAAAGEVPEDAPFFMLNLLRYRERADYGDRTDAAPSSGREVYHERYVPAFGLVAAKWGPMASGSPGSAPCSPTSSDRPTSDGTR
ncbi:MAG: hypothetical protein AVDCRST_MAG12-2566 [uncultured Rubrobacteraceae bacterium]|uniref:Uncharacterized protein n=1 Tax=uncultured Rubrobacteraceae bacterium TaxID=349277 RepID=A0A6J4SLB6_9ACTN|nr:MAG: hypothetical protein AVDCRST_MAG12-2566 [uncultured Rubrobacteraceae bacterium]